MGEPNWIEWAQGYKNGSIEAHKMVDAHRVSDSSRLTWYVAVCGYVLVNSAQFIDRYLPGLSSWEIAVLLLPWAITAIAAIAGHIALVHAATQEVTIWAYWARWTSFASGLRPAKALGTTS